MQPLEKVDLLRIECCAGSGTPVWSARMPRGEAANPGPSSKQRRTQRLRALHRSWDSGAESSTNEGMRGPTQVDSDSEDERPLVRASVVSPDVMVPLEEDFCEPHHSSIQSPEGSITIPASGALASSIPRLRVRIPRHVETLHQHNKIRLVCPMCRVKQRHLPPLRTRRRHPPT